MDKEKFKKEAQESLNELFAKIDELEAKKDKVKADAKVEYDEQLAKLKSEKYQLQTNYEELINSSSEKWDEVKNAFSSATDSFKEGFSKITSIF